MNRIQTAIVQDAMERKKTLAALQKAADADREYLTGAELRRRYGVTEMTIWRWLHDERMNFPRPLVIARRRYFRLADIVAWEAGRFERVA